jgi:hypothetical protein
MTPTKIVLAFAAMTSLLTVFAIQRLPGDERIEVPKVADEVQTSVVKKTDMVRQIDMVAPPVAAMSKPVVTERIVPEAPVATPPVAATEEGEQRPAKKSKQVYASAESNVCTRHNMRKVMTRGGKSWRCRR